MATKTDPDAPFELRSLLSKAGTASHGEQLINAVESAYSEELQAIQLRNRNPKLEDDLDYEAVAKIAGVDVQHVVVAGGTRDPDDAWIRYAGFDESGALIKGAFPLRDLGSSSSDEHISQRDGLEASAAARDFKHAEAKKDAASGEDVEALKARIAELEADAAGDGERTAADVIASLADADRETAEHVLATDDRKTVAKAAQARIAELDADDGA